ncbi:tetratricopeptide repeat protein hypothetical protein [Limosa lapponica baueri]|uniref:Uncharacterized protein n=1 Tax=Limosa lapponica baueri TaxID=1758121 RepID=A0A2I0TAN5_LIMLA|nr:tetratricopeptide repeat protein hypothetical protein [Limosa lapponica baueri]
MFKPEPPHLCLKQAKTIKSNVSATLVRVEYNGAMLGDSSKTDVLPDGTASYDFVTSFECNPDGPNSLADIAQKPVLFTVIEVLQKDKKQKEKTMPLAQAVVDLLPLLQGQCSFKVSAPLYAVLPSPLESLHPEAKDRELRVQAESRKRIVWDMERRYYLDPAAVVTLQKRIAECQYWPVEVCRMTVASATKGKTSKADKGDEDKQIFFHGVAYVNVVPLLCPGVKRIRGAFRVFTYRDSEVLEKTKCQHSVFRDLRMQLGLTKEGSWTSGISTPLSKAFPSKTHKEEKITRKMSSVPKIQLSDASLENENATNLSLDGQQYAEAGTFLVMEIKLDKALVPKRLQEELTRRVKQMIPPRPPLPPRTEGAEKANLSHPVPSLLLSGVVAVMLQHYEEAEIFFESACCLEPSSIVAWTISGLFYELQNNNTQAEMAFREAKKLLQAQLTKERSIPQAAEGAGEKKQTSATSVRSQSPGPDESLPGNARQNQEVSYGLGAAWEVVNSERRNLEVFLRGEIQRVKEEDVDCGLTTS